MSTHLRLDDFEPEALYDQSELCPKIRKSLAWAERARWSGTGPAYHKIGRRVFYKGADVLAWIDASRIEPTRA